MRTTTAPTPTPIPTPTPTLLVPEEFLPVSVGAEDVVSTEELFVALEGLVLAASMLV